MNIYDYEQFKVQAQKQKMELKKIDVEVYVSSNVETKKNHEILEVKSLKIVASEIFRQRVIFGSAEAEA